MRLSALDFFSSPASILCLILFVPGTRSQTNDSFPTYAFTTVAGKGTTPGSTDATGSDARFNAPTGVAVDELGFLYVADFNNHTIRKITPDGAVSTLAGQPGVAGSSDLTGTGARFNKPRGIAVDRSGYVYVAERGNHAIRKISPAGLVSTLAGKAGVSGSADGAGPDARFFNPSSVAVDGAGFSYVGDSENNTIRKITPSGTVSTLAGKAGIAGYADGAGENARFSFPTGVAVDSQGNVYVTDYSNHAVRKITPNGLVSTLAGRAQPYSGTTDGSVKDALFWILDGVAVDNAGFLFVIDRFNHTIRGITPSGFVSTLAGQPTPNSIASVDGVWTNALFVLPTGVAVDHSGNVYIAGGGDNDHAIHKGTPLTTLPPPIITAPPRSYTALIGETVAFTVSADGKAPLVYQWRKDGEAAGGDHIGPVTANPSYAITNVQPSHAGTYRVMVTSAYGSTLSSGAVLTVVAEIVSRTLPATYEPAVSFGVFLRAAPPVGTASYSIEETPPNGWTLGAISDGGVYDPATGSVRFGPYFDALPRNLMYQIKPPFGETGRKEFAGTVSVDAQTSPIAGALAIMDMGATKVLSDCSFAALETAVQAGGNLLLDCQGPIYFERAISVRNNASLSASSLTTLSGRNAVRLFIVETNTHLSLKNLLIRDGAEGAKASPDGAGPFTTGTNVYGGAIWNRGGRLTLSNCTFEANSVRGGDGGAPAGPYYPPTPGRGGGAFGGAIMSSNGFVQIESCIFRSNNVRGGAGGPAGLAIFSASGGSASGSALHQIGGDLVINGTTFDSNEALAGAEGPATRSSFSSPNSLVRGGAIAIEGARVLVSECLFLTNSVKDGSACGGAIFAASSPSIEIVNTDFLGNSAAGGVTLWIANGNASARGGALYLNGSDATIRACFWHGNSAVGGIVRTQTHSAGTDHSYGGALFCDGTVSVQKSSFFANYCSGATGGNPYFPVNQPGNGYGGAIYNTRNLVVENSTLASNYAGGGTVQPPLFQFERPPLEASIGSGGAIANTGTCSLVHCTFASNSAFSFATNAFGTNGVSAPDTGGSIANDGTLRLEKTILASSSSNNFKGSVVDLGENLSSDSTPVFTVASSRNTIDPLLAPFRYYRGRTPTMPLRSGSPALNAASPSTRFPTDQRGEPRPYGTLADIGAYELTPAATNNVIEVGAVRQEIVLTLLSTPADQYTLLSSTNLAIWQSVLTNSTDNLGRLQWKVPISTEPVRIFQGRRIQP